MIDKKINELEMKIAAARFKAAQLAQWNILQEAVAKTISDPNLFKRIGAKLQLMKEGIYFKEWWFM